MFDGWCASQGTDPFELPWDRFLNLVYHFAVRNASKEKKQEFDNAVARAVSVDNMHTMAASRKKAPNTTQSGEQQLLVPEGTIKPQTQRRSGLPPRPAGWGDDETAMRQSLAAAQSLKVASKTQQ